jgi:hypothetical protein
VALLHSDGAGGEDVAGPMSRRPTVMPRLQDEWRHSGVVIQNGSSDGALGKLDSSALIFSSPSSFLCVDVLGNREEVAHTVAAGKREMIKSLEGKERREVKD